MEKAIDIIKRGGQRPSEAFDRDKLQISIRAACLSARAPEGEAEAIARMTADAVAAWCLAKPEVTSNDLRRVATQTLARHHPDAAYLYKHHRLVM